jgi:S1-C subfamily serine protease
MHRHARRIKPGLLILIGALLALAAAPPTARTAPLSPSAGRLLAGPQTSPSVTRGPHRSSNTHPAAPQTAAVEPFALLSSVVRIEAKAAQGAESARSLGAQRSGTGVLLDQTTVLTIGYLLLEAEELVMVTPSGKRIPGNVAGYDAVSGFGLVQSVLPLDGQPPELGDSDAVKEMERVLTLGHGEGLPTELLVVSRKPFAGSWEYVLDSGIFTYPPVNNWSGAALISADGKLVGIGSLLVNDAAADRQGVPGNLYVPVNILKPILKDLLATGRRAGPPQPWLGVSTEFVQGNLIVSRVTPGGPAEQAGLAAGDIIVSVGGERVANQAEFYRHIWKLGPAGVTVPLRVLKSGDVQDVPVKTIDRMSTLRKPQGV